MSERIFVSIALDSPHTEFLANSYGGHFYLRDEVYDWLTHFTPSGLPMGGSNDRSEGIVIEFGDVREAVLFKLAWGGK